MDTKNKGVDCAFGHDYVNPITHGGGGMKTQVGFNALFDPEVVKIEHSYFMSFPKCFQRPFKPIKQITKTYFFI